MKTKQIKDYIQKIVELLKEEAIENTKDSHVKNIVLAKKEYCENELKGDLSTLERIQYETMLDCYKGLLEIF